ncbi:hypothetical protein BDN72DRAFT_876233 [Pluteus cervinus]|uniref:Uncharacterized protein n=1 Tax=Pluteus cervinus TaxID=181527 RepID=A0ACD3B567_9AGAR|nr:hypothetical protein BDN72DRAFT_876233 [Pluteus cervinus]
METFTFPPELTEQILTTLGDDITTILTLSVVSSQFVQPSQRQLFSRVVVDCRLNSAQLQDRLFQLLAITQDSPHLFHYIRALEIMGGSFPSDCVDLFSQILPRLVHLRSLKLDGVNPLKSSFISVLERYLPLLPIIRLSISSIDNVPWHLLVSCPTITHLSIKQSIVIGLGHDGSPMPFALEKRLEGAESSKDYKFPRLDTLILCDPITPGIPTDDQNKLYSWLLASKNLLDLRTLRHIALDLGNTQEAQRLFHQSQLESLDISTAWLFVGQSLAKDLPFEHVPNPIGSHRFSHLREITFRILFTQLFHNVYSQFITFIRIINDFPANNQLESITIKVLVKSNYVEHWSQLRLPLLDALLQEKKFGGLRKVSVLIMIPKGWLAANSLFVTISKALRHNLLRHSAKKGLLKISKRSGVENALARPTVSLNSDPT